MFRHSTVTPTACFKAKKNGKFGNKLAVFVLQLRLTEET